MDRLCDEVIQLIFYELADPGPLALVSRRFHSFSQDPYVRALYFLVRYGPNEAMFHALGRGKVLTERVLDILLASGAQLSRYLIQISIHHFFHAQTHFIKTPWVRNVPLRVFTYFLKLSEELYGEIPRGKGEDDGSVFSTFLKESRLPLGMRNVTWETIREILESYSFIPFSAKDPIMAQFPLALAIEPRLLPYAVKNGFYMDSKYRDFVFRRMFERPAVPGEASPEDIASNIRELCRLDATMFVSRTVAAEVCMEAKSNDTAYSALKQLDKSGDLRFELRELVEDLIKTFIRTRSIGTAVSIDILRYLYTDFPSSDPTARLVILITLFITSENLHSSPIAIHAKLEAMGLTPISKRDVYNILVNPFVDRYHVLLDYARWGIGDKDGRKGMNEDGIRELVEEVAWRCLELACKGKFLKKLYDGYSFLHSAIIQRVMENYQIVSEDLPSSYNRRACRSFRAKLCQDYTKHMTVYEGYNDDDEVSEQSEDGDSSENSMEVVVENEPEEVQKDDLTNLGIITQETLTTMIRHDEVLPLRSRRRVYYPYGLYVDSSGRLPYPPDPLPIARWIKSEFGPKSSITAVFMTHAVINDNTNILHHYTQYADGNASSTTASHVPVTLKHFRILARLGRTPNFYLYHEIEFGAEFYFDEDDYLKKDAEWKVGRGAKAVKVESSTSILPPTSARGRSQTASSALECRGKKRPRRRVNTIPSYAVPDSDDEAIAHSDEAVRRIKPIETSLQKWIYHLSELAKVELRKYKEEKKNAEMAAEPGTRVRVSKNDFFKSLSSHLRNLRRVEVEKRIKLYGPDIIAEECSDDDDNDLEYKTRHVKRKRTS